MHYFWSAVKTLLGLILRRPILGTSVVPVLPTGEIVLMRRRDTGDWGLPGGIIDWGENIASAAKRELREETGLEMVGVERLIGIYSAPGRDPRFHSICVALAVHVSGTPCIGDPHEVLDVRAFSRDQLLVEQFSHDHHQQTKDYLDGATVLA